ncbi:MAG: triose-phosphate isomerase [Maioricimonas sp. JB049]
MRRILVAGNWKMNTTAASGVELARGVAAGAPAAERGVDVLVAPPFPYLVPVKEALQGSVVQLGAQNAYFEESGAFTGEVSVDMLLDVGCNAVILGHSERRHVLGETDETINRKVKASLAKELQVILCVGELLDDREAGRTEAILDAQMAGGLADVDARSLKDIVIAYEPVWAIGTGRTATPDQAESAHAHLRKWLADRYNTASADSMQILYGGSVKPANAKELIGQDNVDGALVGGASLSVEDFLGIMTAATEVAAG